MWTPAQKRRLIESIQAEELLKTAFSMPAFFGGARASKPNPKKEFEQHLREERKKARGKRKYRRVAGVLLAKDVPYLRSVPKDPEEAKDFLRERISESRDIWSHPQVATKKLDLKGLGFKPSRISVPLPGERAGTKTWRSGTLHAHKSGPLYLVHQDSMKAGLKHIIKDVPPALRARRRVGPAVKTASIMDIAEKVLSERRVEWPSNV